MAYARFSYADLYVFMHYLGHLECCGCWLGEQWAFYSTNDMIDHIGKHRAAGHNVPDGLEDSIRVDDETNFPPQCADGHDWGELFYPYGEDRDPFIQSLTRRKCRRCGWER